MPHESCTKFRNRDSWFISHDSNDSVNLYSSDEDLYEFLLKRGVTGGDADFLAGFRDRMTRGSRMWMGPGVDNAIAAMSKRGPKPGLWDMTYNQ